MGFFFPQSINKKKKNLLLGRRKEDPFTRNNPPETKHLTLNPKNLIYSLTLL